MKHTLTAIIGKTKNNYAACVEEVDGFVCTADTLEELKQEIKDGVEFHLEGMRKDGDPIPKVLQGEFDFKYKWNVESLLYYYKGIISFSALEKLTGINQGLLGHYAAGRKKPRRPQILKIEKALKQLGSELSAVSF